MTATTLEGQREGTLSNIRFLPFIAVVMRFGLIMLGNFIWWIGLRATGNPSPWENAILWSNVHVVVIADVLSVIFLIWAMRREGATLRDLFGFERTKIVRDVLIGLGVFLILMIALYAGNVIAMLAVMGPSVFSQFSGEMPAIDISKLPPLWYYIWGAAVLPISVGIVEELVYRGYAQPRLEAALGNKWLAVLVMALGFGLQHVAFAAMDVQFALVRFIGTFIAGIVFGLLYMKLRRLLPLIIGHWLVDLIGLGLFPLIMYLSLMAK